MIRHNTMDIVTISQYLLIVRIILNIILIYYFLNLVCCLKYIFKFNNIINKSLNKEINLITIYIL